MAAFLVSSVPHCFFMHIFYTVQAGWKFTQEQREHGRSCSVRKPHLQGWDLHTSWGEFSMFILNLLLRQLEKEKKINLSFVGFYRILLLEVVAWLGQALIPGNRDRMGGNGLELCRRSIRDIAGISSWQGWCDIGRCPRSTWKWWQRKENEIRHTNTLESSVENLPCPARWHRNAANENGVVVVTLGVRSQVHPAECWNPPWFSLLEGYWDQNLSGRDYWNPEIRKN